jgi:FkbM family methyltransferase
MGDRGTILAIEPSRELAARLRENVRLNGMESIVIKEVAAGESTGFAASDPAVADHGSAGFASRDVSAGAPSAVPMMPLLDIVREAGIARIDVLKIDIEGFEDRALLPFFGTAPESLWPHVIAMEAAHRQRWQSDVVARLESLSYRIIAKGRVDLVLERKTA